MPLQKNNSEIYSCSIRVRGTVQGVGFRPFVYRTALLLGLKGIVKNDAQGVLIECFGTKESIEKLTKLLLDEAPPLSVVTSVELSRLQKGTTEYSSFSIAETEKGGGLEIDIARDTATCTPCLAEMRDPENRRFQHPFINCTDCGPRYTIIKSLPYDRSATTMADFPMCPACRAEYEDPMSRRFHAQPICCPACGPQLLFLDGNGTAVPVDDPIAACVEALQGGKIIAIKGIGGFHLACRADRSEIVQRLRERKHREEKPFALMARDSASAREIAHISDSEARLLESIERPIVILQKRPEVQNKIADEVAPGLPTLGIMLPCAPLQFLAFDKSDFIALVMTSANRTDEPMVHENKEAIAALKGIADGYLLHDRPIIARTDDSIVRLAAGSPVLFRRGRGFMPDPLPAPCDLEGIVGCGGVLKSTLAIGRGDRCYVSQYVGNAENAETLGQLDKIKNHLQSLLGIVPSLYAVDLHPDTLSSRIATPEAPSMRIQHHHAHAAACMAENGLTAPAVCVVYDGTGYGSDGTLWGGEILCGDYRDYHRAGHLAPMLLPGGEEGIRHPWRMAMGALFPIMGEQTLLLFPEIAQAERFAVLELLVKKVSCNLTSGMGRLFDAMSAFLGICMRRTYEGQPAIMLEAAAEAGAFSAYGTRVLKQDDGALIINGPVILFEALKDFESGASAGVVAARFHETIAQATAEAAAAVAREENIESVCLSGGCFQNTLLLDRTTACLRNAGLHPFVHRLMPPNDESISYGQAVIAGMRRKGK